MTNDEIIYIFRDYIPKGIGKTFISISPKLLEFAIKYIPFSNKKLKKDLEKDIKQAKRNGDWLHFHNK